MDLKLLREPFPEDRIEWRVAQAGKTGQTYWARVLAYISARDIQDRLDQVCGPENWKVSYRSESTPSHSGIVCTLSIQVGDQWITKEDGSEQSEIEPFKGGLSGALKRAGAAWGIGRYLYDLEAGFAEIVDQKIPGSKWAKAPDGSPFYWKPPRLPAWALPPSKSSSPPASGSSPDPHREIVFSRLSLGTQIMELAALHNISKKDVEEWATEVSGVKPDQMTIPQMSDFLEKMQKELAGVGRIK